MSAKSTIEWTDATWDDMPQGFKRPGEVRAVKGLSFGKWEMALVYFVIVILFLLLLLRIQTLTAQLDLLTAQLTLVQATQEGQELEQAKQRQELKALRRILDRELAPLQQALEELDRWLQVLRPVTE